MNCHIPFRTGTVPILSSFFLLALSCLSTNPGSVVLGDQGVGTLKGRIVFQGKVPPPKILPVKRDQNICGKTFSYQPLLVDESSGGVQYVVLSLEGLPAPPGRESEELATFVNKDCAFHPRVRGAEVGQKLQLLNKDPMLHNTHIRLGKRTFINVAQVVGGRPITKQLRDVGVMRVSCDKHKFMEGFLLAFDHPYFSVTNERGEYTLTQIPSGTWTLTIWHQTLGTLETRVVISPGKELKLDMAFPER